MERPASYLLALAAVVLSLPLICHGISSWDSGTEDGSEEWGYVEVRPKAYLFWWLYRSSQRIENPSKPWPTVLWIQGGPGSSATGIGNFEEVGPHDLDLNPRNLTWLKKADLLFVDSPVGTGFSFVEDEDLVVTSEEEAINDLMTLLKELCNRSGSLQKSPLFIVGESYGGKLATLLGLSVLNAIEAGELKLKLTGIAMGNGVISFGDLVLSWGPLLKDVARLDNNGAEKSNSLAQKIKEQTEQGHYKVVNELYIELQSVITSGSNSVDFYNFMLDSSRDPISPKGVQSMPMDEYSFYLSSKYSSSVKFQSFMNSVVRDKLKIIPKDVIWEEKSDLVYSSLSNDIFKSRINEVDELLQRGVNVVIYVGQLDVVASTMGTYTWVQRLKWDGLRNFSKLDRSPIYCDESGSETKGFVKSYKNLHIYSILGAGHFVPVDQPCIALKMAGEIINLPVSSS